MYPNYNNRYLHYKLTLQIVKITFKVLKQKYNNLLEVTNKSKV